MALETAFYIKLRDVSRSSFIATAIATTIVFINV